MLSIKKEEAQPEEEPKGYLSDDNKRNHIKFVFQDCNINFLIGSGLSTPFFGTLGKIEEWLTDLEKKKSDLEDEEYIFIKASLYNAYFEVAMQGNIDILNFSNEVTEYLEIGDTDTEEDNEHKRLNNTFLNYKDFLNTLSHILYERRSNTVSKQVNLFTTNINKILVTILNILISE